MDKKLTAKLGMAFEARLGHRAHAFSAFTNDDRTESPAVIERQIAKVGYVVDTLEAALWAAGTSVSFEKPPSKP